MSIAYLLFVLFCLSYLSKIPKVGIYVDDLIT